jgi:hypothetical protein
VGKVFADIDERNAEFMLRQRVFFVGTAPLAADGLLNLSPKDMRAFAVLGPLRVAYLDLVGSGIETVANLRENGRIVLMFCAFEGPPRIFRLHGRGTAVLPGSAEWDELAQHFEAGPGARAIVSVEVDRVSDSCGYGVPLYTYEGERTQMDQWVDRKGPAGLDAYELENNTASLNGLPGLDRSRGRSD